jgi:hypothetical protein
VLDAPAYARLGNRVTTPGPFLVEGRLRREGRAVRFVVSSIVPFHERAKAGGGGTLPTPPRAPLPVPPRSGVSPVVSRP